MNVKVILVLLLGVGFLIPDSSLFAQSSKSKLIQLMREYVGMVDYDGETFFMNEIKSMGGTEIRFKSYEKYASPTQLFLDLSKIKTSTLSVKSLSNTRTGEFKYFQIRFQGIGSLYQQEPGMQAIQYSDIHICLAGKELYNRTTFNREIADSLMVLLKEASVQAKNMRKSAPVKTYKLQTANSLMVELLNAKEHNFQANNRSGGYITLSGGMKEFYGTVKTVCLEYVTETPLSEIQTDVSLDVIYILVRNYQGKRETVAEIPDTITYQSGSLNCCKNCLTYPDRESFPSGAYEVFIYLGEQQTRKLGSYNFAVR